MAEPPGRRSSVRRRGAGREPARQCDQLPQTERAESRAEREVFAERHEVDLVVGGADLAAVVDDVDAVEDQRRRRRWRR